MKAGDLRTKGAEQVIQSFTPEEESWYYATRDVERKWNYARNVARTILRNNLLLEQTKGTKYAQGLAEDTGLIRQTVVLLEVDHSFVEATVELVKVCFSARYGRGGWRGKK